MAANAVFQTELDREDMKHHEMMLITDFRLHLSPIPETPDKILDLGTGTGKSPPPTGVFPLIAIHH